MTSFDVLSPRTARGSVETEVLALLKEVDAEFLPPLSQRVDTTALSASAQSPRPSVSAYFEAMRHEHWLVATEGKAVVGLISFERRSLEDAPIEKIAPCLYATTTAVAPRARGTGLATRMYGELTRIAVDWGVPYVTTRTWTTNDQHNRILVERGFRAVRHVPHERGNAVGTIYFAKAVVPSREAISQ